MLDLGDFLTSMGGWAGYYVLARAAHVLFCGYYQTWRIARMRG